MCDIAGILSFFSYRDCRFPSQRISHVDAQLLESVPAQAYRRLREIHQLAEGNWPRRARRAEFIEHTALSLPLRFFSLSLGFISSIRYYLIPTAEQDCRARLQSKTRLFLSLACPLIFFHPCALLPVPAGCAARWLLARSQGVVRRYTSRKRRAKFIRHLTMAARVLQAAVRCMLARSNI